MALTRALTATARFTAASVFTYLIFVGAASAITSAMFWQAYGGDPDPRWLASAALLNMVFSIPLTHVLNAHRIHTAAKQAHTAALTLVEAGAYEPVVTEIFVRVQRPSSDTYAA